MEIDQRKYPVPWDQLTKEEQNGFTLNGRIELAENWISKDIKFSKSPTHHSKADIEDFQERIRRKETFSYEDSDVYLYQALRKFKIKNQQVAIFGSLKPWYEAFCMVYGGHPTTIEYSQITTDHPDLKTYTVDELDQSSEVFDAGFSISSYEHDGLGRYGDPINPNGDLETMQKIKNRIRKKGLLFLSIPVGKDKVCYNAHRVYGRIRLPMMLEGWKLLKSFGFKKEIFDVDYGNRSGPQPIFVLRNI